MAESIIEDDIWFNELDEMTIDIISKEVEVVPIVSQNDSPLEIPNIYNPNDKLTEYIYIEDILEKNPETIYTIEIIQHQCSLISGIQILLDGDTHNKIKKNNIYIENIEYDKIVDIIIYLKWISLASKTLADRIGQELIKYIPNDDHILMRSSYNFCTKQTQCKNFYNNNNIITCKDHHYVHAILKYDTDSIISFLTYINLNKIKISQEQLSNLHLSIKTIGFVTRHMAKEINYIDYITQNKSEMFHKNNIFNYIKKNNNNKNTKGNFRSYDKKEVSPTKTNNKSSLTTNRYEALHD